MRKKLGLYANIRPTFTFEELIDKSPLKKELIQGTDIVFLLGNLLVEYILEKKVDQMTKIPLSIHVITEEMKLKD